MFHWWEVALFPWWDVALNPKHTCEKYRGGGSGGGPVAAERSIAWISRKEGRSAGLNEKHCHTARLFQINYFAEMCSGSEEGS